MKKAIVVFYGLLYILYAIALLKTNVRIGDIVSPILTFLAFFYILKGFFLAETSKIQKVAGCFLALSVFLWFLCDAAWGISTLIFHMNPQNSTVITYGYSITNLFLLVSFIISGYQEIKHWNKMQVFLDTLLISVSIMVLVWVFVFEQDVQKANIIKQNIVAMLSMMADAFLFAWTNIWFFSIRKNKILLSAYLSVLGVAVFVITDFIYYYQIFYYSYEPNSLLDGGYMLAFTLLAIAGLLKTKKQKEMVHNTMEDNVMGKHGKEIIFLAVLVIMVLFRGDQIQYLFFMITLFLLYYVFKNYIQANEFNRELLQKEKEYVEELEAQVEERTEAIVKALNTDIVTELYSRYYFEEYLEKVCEAEEGKHSIQLFYIEQNKYRSILAMYGKYAAEAFLKEVVRRMKKIALEKGVFLASYGENSFMMVVKGNYTYEEGLHLADYIIHTCSDTYTIANHDIVGTLNIGISYYPFDAKTAENLIKCADSAMVHAKKIGFNRVLQYNTKIGKEEDYKNQIEMKLKSVKFDEEFQLFYQPQVFCDNGTIFGVEALIRWKSKDGTYIPPSEFIPITEETGLIVPLGYWILEQGIMQAVRWEKEYAKKIKMAINVSVKQLEDPAFISNLRNILQKYQIEAENIELEITENVQLEENGGVLDIIHQISDMGLSIAIDDFGTGYSSLYYLKNLPINRLKIAKQLIDNMEVDSYDYTIIKMVIQIANARGIKVIAEGVETKEQWNCLKELKCDEIQGYYFARPMPVTDIEKNWLQ
ncbi:MAG: putative bifunctional diguanylate cyclase/phosphodiesterase [Velocimicrobium sp.]